MAQSTFALLDDAELSTILAALRHYQATGQCDSPNDIATNNGTVEPLDEGAIDALCERLNAADDELPQFGEGETVRLLTDTLGADQDGGEHHLTAAELATIPATVARVSHLSNGQGWQYDISIPVMPGHVDEEGDPLTITVAIDETDRDAAGNLPVERFIVPTAAGAPQQGTRKPRL